MQIQLKQREIEAALKMYISSQGINLTGKIVTIDFTAGRKDSGLSADLTIEETETANFENSRPAGLTENPPSEDEVPVKAGNIFSK